MIYLISVIHRLLIQVSLLICSDFQLIHSIENVYYNVLDTMR